MKPNFAFSLSFDGIRLLHRATGGWHLVGEVALDADDVEAGLAGLRRAALALAPEGVRSKLLIPNDQIRYLTIENAAPTEIDLRAALENATPYEVDELVFDHSSDGTRTHIAAVARETLFEAEAFASEHRFDAVCFAAVPEPCTFEGEPFFGPTRAASVLLGRDALVERDERPVVVIARSPAPFAGTAPVSGTALAFEEPVFRRSGPRGDDAPMVHHDVVADLLGADEGGNYDSASGARGATGGAEMAGRSMAEADGGDDDADSADASRADRSAAAPASSGEAGPARPDATPEASPAHAPVTPAYSRETVSGPSTVTSVAPPEANRADMRAPSTDAGRDSSGVTPESGTGMRPAHPADMPAPSPDAGPEPSTVTPDARPAVTPGPSSERRDDASSVAPTSTGESSSASPSAAPLSAPQAAALAATLTARAPGEAAPLPPRTPPGRRNALSAQRAPRLLGLVLTVILLVFLAGVAAWGALGGDGPLAGWFDAPATKEPEVADAVSPQAEADDRRIALAAGRPDTAQATDAVGGSAEADPVAASADATPLIGDAPETSPSTAASDAGAPVAAEAQDAEGDEATTAAAQGEAAPAPLPAGRAPGRVLSPAEAERFHAATGVWQRAPRLPLLPRTETLVGLRLGQPDLPPERETLKVAGATASLPPLPLAPVRAAPDVGVQRQIDPPAPGTVFERDARGFILATAEGTATPSGAVVFAGRPDVLPPVRPGTPQPEAGDETGAEASAAADAQAVPAASAEAAATEATSPETSTDATATPGGVTLASLRPILRPVEDGAASDDAAGPPLDPSAQPRPDLADDRPRVRPASLVPPETAPAIEQALEEAVAPILENETRRAVAQSLRPENRPTNFARVVEEAVARMARVESQAQQRAEEEAEAQADAEEAEDTQRQIAAARPAAPAPAPATIVQPTGPISGGVASAATQERAINLRDMNLIGVYGQPSARRALIRLSNGRYVKVGVGDTLDGGQVSAIGVDALNYVKRGRTYALQIPSG